MLGNIPSNGSSSSGVGRRSQRGALGMVIGGTAGLVVCVQSSEKKLGSRAHCECGRCCGEGGGVTGRACGIVSWCWADVDESFVWGLA